MQGQGPHAIDDLSLLDLSLLYGKTLAPALKIASDPSSVTRLCSPSGRECFRVKSSNISEPFYHVFTSSHYCSCPAFLHEVCLKGESLACKHLLAVLILGMEAGRIELSDIEMANHLADKA